MLHRLVERLRRGQAPALPARVAVLWDADAELGECPRWDAATGVLHWIDIPAGLLHRYGTRASDRRTWRVGAEVAALAPGPAGTLVLALGDVLHRFDPATEQTTPWCTLPGLDPSACRANDAAVAPDGALWVATMARDGARPLGRLYRVAPSGAASVLPGAYRIANGPAFDAGRGVAYVADSPLRVIHRVPLDRPEQATRFATFAERDGYPDGMAVDADGQLLVAHYDGGCVSRWTPDGRCVGRYLLPTPRPTAVALAPGDDGRPRLLVTSARSAAGGGALYEVVPA